MLCDLDDPCPQYSPSIINMIVSDRYKFAFIHIPKNGGTSIRASLQSLHDLNVRFSGRGYLGENYVWLDHLPLDRLSRDFPEVIARLETYDSFATFRHPITRFGSALSEYIQQVKRTEPANASRRLFVEAYREVEAKLTKYPHVLDWKFIYFRCQSDFIFLNGRQMVKTVVPVAHMDLILQRASALTGQEFALHHRNPTLEYRGHVAAWLSEGRKLAHVLLRDHYAKSRRLGQRILMRHGKNDNKNLALSHEMTEFIKEFYKRDFGVFASLRLNRGSHD